MKPHVHCLCFFLLNLVVVDAVCCGIVGLHWCWWLQVSHFCEYVSEVDSFFCIDENPSELCFWCGGHDCFYDLRYVKDGAVVWGNVCFWWTRKHFLLLYYVPLVRCGILSCYGLQAPCCSHYTLVRRLSGMQCSREYVWCVPLSPQLVLLAVMRSLIVAWVTCCRLPALKIKISCDLLDKFLPFCIQAGLFFGCFRVLDCCAPCGGCSNVRGVSPEFRGIVI